MVNSPATARAFPARRREQPRGCGLRAPGVGLVPRRDGVPGEVANVHRRDARAGDLDHLTCYVTQRTAPRDRALDHDCARPGWIDALTGELLGMERRRAIGHDQDLDPVDIDDGGGPHGEFSAGHPWAARSVSAVGDAHDPAADRHRRAMPVVGLATY